MPVPPMSAPSVPANPDNLLDEPRGEPLRSPSRVKLPVTGLRRIDHPDPTGLPPPEVKVVSAWRVSCDGGEGAMGHPRVWLSIPHTKGFIDCGYCDARFLHRDFAGAGDPAAAQVPCDVGAGNPADHTQPADLDRGAVRGPQAGRAPGGA